MELYKKPNRFSVAPNCPCGKSNKDGKFVPFIIGSKVLANAGYCHSCGKTFYPDKKYEFNNSLHEKVEIKRIGFEVVSESLHNYQKNNFTKWLTSININIQDVLKHYKIGTGKDESTIFWYIDYYGMARTAKVMHYNMDGRRNKNRTPSFMYTKRNGYGSCLFGENLLKSYGPSQVVVLVESEKTAVIGNHNFPDYCWIATGGSNGLTRSKAKVLENRKIIVVPDCDEPGRISAERTRSILHEINASVTVCDIDLNLKNGEDIADLVI